MDFQSSFTDSPAQRGAILVRDVVARFRGSVLSGYPVLLMFRHPLNPNRWEKGSHSLREATMPWREARLLSCPQLIHLAGSSVASLCFHLSPRNDNAFHFCFTDICYQEHWLHSLIHRDERCWINSELYLLFSLLLLVKLPSTLLTSCQKLCRMSSPWTSKYRLQRLDYYFFFSFLAVKNDFKSQYLGWWYFWRTLSSFKLFLYSPFLRENKRAEEKLRGQPCLGLQSPLGVRARRLSSGCPWEAVATQNQRLLGVQFPGVC